MFRCSLRCTLSNHHLAYSKFSHQQIMTLLKSQSIYEATTTATSMMASSAPAPTPQEVQPTATTRRSVNASAMVSNPDHPKKPINLLRGWPSTSLLPTAALDAASRRLLSNPSLATPALLYGPDPGFEPLRGALAAWLTDFYYGGGVDADTDTTGAIPVPAPAPDIERITVSGGASQCIACILQSFTDPAYTRAIWMVSPCYFLACPIFADAGFGGAGRMRAVPEDDEGIDLAVLEAGLRNLSEEEAEAEEEEAAAAGREETNRFYKDPGPHRKIYRHVIYCVPSFSNPSGKTMSLRRRQGLLELARRYDALVICDDVYDMLQWRPATSTSSSSSGKAAAAQVVVDDDDLNKALLPRLTDLERASDGSATPSPHDPPGKRFGHAVSNGSFSKLVGPGLRTGWTESTPDFAHGLAQTGSTRSGGAPSQFAAAVLYELLVSGSLASHLRETLRPAYRRRHGLVVETAARMRLGGGGGQQQPEQQQQQQQPKEEEGNMTTTTTSTTTTGMTRSLAGRDDVFGGYFVWFRLPGGLRADDVARRCQAEENLAIGAGGLFAVRGDAGASRFEHEVRLCFAWEDEADLEEGVTRLGHVVARMLRGAPPMRAAVGAGGGGGKGVDELK